MISSIVQNSIRQSWAEDVLTSLPDPLTYIEDPGYLGEPLYPVQRVVVKLSYGIPLDDREKVVDVRNDTNTETLYMLTETEYLRYLYEEGRCNWEEQQEAPNEVWLGAGRRSGKTLLLGHLDSYALLKLLSLKNPQEYYGISKKTDIGVVVVSTSLRQAQEMLNVASADVSELPFFGYLSDPKLLGTVLKFRLPPDEEELDETGFMRPFKLNLSTFCMDSATSRGFSIIQLVFDEYAFFLNEKQKHTSESVYDALVPSTGTFGKDYKIFYASSLGAKRGKFFDLHEKFFTPGSRALCLKVPSWHMNPGLSPELLSSFKLDVGFGREFGSDYENQDLHWLDNAKVEACVEEVSLPHTRGRYYFMGSDLGLIHDETVHTVITPDAGKVHVVDHVFYEAGVGEFKDQKALDIAVMASRGESLFTKYRCQAGCFDQWNAFGYSSLLSARVQDRYQGFNFSERLNHEMWSLLEGLVNTGRLVIPEKFRSLADYLQDLDDVSQKKGIIKVVCSNGGSPDRAESLARAVLSLYRYLELHPSLKKQFGLLEVNPEFLDSLKFISMVESGGRVIRSQVSATNAGVTQPGIQNVRLQRGLSNVSNRAAFLRRVRR